MSFVVLLLAILVEKFSALRQRLQCDSGWLRELHKLEASPKLANRPWWVLAILILFPVLVLGLLLWVLEPVAYGLLVLPVHLLVLIYSLGRGDLLAGLGPVRDAWRPTSWICKPAVNRWRCSGPTSAWVPWCFTASNCNTRSTQQLHRHPGLATSDHQRHSPGTGRELGAQHRHRP